jgi:hypothetical protein
MLAMFKVQLSRLDGDKAQVRVVESPIGEPRQTVAAPFDAATVSGLLKVLESGELRRSRLAEEERGALEQLGLIQDGRLLGAEARNRRIGQGLYDALFPMSEDRDHNVRAALDAALNLARETRNAVPFQLRFDSDAVDLASLPWELICDGEGRHLVAEGWLRFTRYITFGQVVTPFPVAGRLEVLVITARPVDAQPLDENAEREAIERAFSDLQKNHRVRIKHLEPPTLEALVAAMNGHAYHIVHFDGHGEFARRCPVCDKFTSINASRCAATQGCRTPLADVEPEGVLAFEREDRRMHLVGAKELATALSTSRVNLFVASACRSATVGGRSVFGSVGPRLVLAGVPAVVAMQFSVPASDAASFASEFYAGLARGESIAAATAAGRRLLFDHGHWYIPTVYLRNDDGEGYIFRQNSWLYFKPTHEPPPDWALLRPRDAAPYKLLSPYEISDHVVFHGRQADTERVMEELLHRRFVVLYGPPSVGKTSLVNAGLSPALIERGHLVLTVGGDGHPLQLLRQEVASSPALDVDLTGAEDLTGIVRALLEGVGQPLVVVFDDFDGFIRSAGAEQRQTFARQFADYVAADLPLPSSVLLVLRDDALGNLQDFQTHVPDFFHNIIRPLGRLSCDEAREAIERPLAHHDPPLQFDPDFLEHTLLPALCTEAEAGAVHPAHLQILCHDLYRCARREGDTVIGRRHYPPGGAAAILTNYLSQTLAERFAQREEREAVRSALKQMVSATGERKFVTLDHVTRETGSTGEQVQATCDVLLKAGLLETRAERHGPVTYSLSHHLLVEEVGTWFDRKEALARGAQETLDRAWDDWYAGVNAVRLEGPSAASDVRFLLVGPNRLREIRTWAHRIKISGPQHLLLLRSAVHRRVDMAYWARQVGGNQEARELLRGIHDGVDDEGLIEQIALGAEALGLDPEDIGERALARAAVAHRDGNVRHTAALALGALGLDIVANDVGTLAEAAPRGRGCRRVQALAQMKVAGFPLPQLRLFSLAQVNGWTAGIRLYEARWRLVTQAGGAGLLGGFLLALLMAPVWLAAGYRHADKIAVYVLLGLVVGALVAAGRWLFDVLLATELGRVLGSAAGFGLALLALAPYTPNLAASQVLGGVLAGGAIGAGWELLARPGRPWAWWKPGLGGALGGTLFFAATSLTPLRIPFVLREEAAVFFTLGDQPLRLALVVIVAALMGAFTGAGLAAGAAGGEVLLHLPMVPRTDAAVFHPVAGQSGSSMEAANVVAQRVAAMEA